MKNYLILLLPLMVGCLSSAPKAPVNWTIDFTRCPNDGVRADGGKEAVRIASVDVRAPYAGVRLVVLRPDGSIVFDAFNAFAGSPAQLMLGTMFDAVEASGKFGRVLPPSSAAKTRYSIELVVTQLALDCREKGRRTAKIAFMLILLDGREVAASVRGNGSAEAGDDYSAAFSEAFVHAMQDAMVKLPVR